jgi:hypothetical protein
MTGSGFVLATPPPSVGPAVADKAPIEDAAIADRAEPTEAAVAVKANVVDAALPFDDPMSHAPDFVRNPKMSKSPEMSIESLRRKAQEESKICGSRKFFESYAAVIQGTPSKNILRICLPCVFDERDFVSYGEVRKYIFVTSQRRSCFIYGDIIDHAPLYSIDLSDYVALREDPNNPDPNSFTISPVPNTNKPRDEMVTILLKTKSDLKQSYQFTFDTTNDSSLPDQFLSLFDNENTIGIIQQPGSHAVSATMSGGKISKKLNDFEEELAATCTPPSRGSI